jgi:hypothetical protein
MRKISLPVAIAILFAGALAPAGAQQAPRPHRDAMREIPDAQKFLIANETKGAPDKKGWYYHVLNVADTPEGLLCVYRKTDAHTALMSDIMSARSTNGGRTWTDHKLISHSDVWNEGGLWVAPQLTRLRDGRLVIIADFGRRTTGQNWPMLSQWQKPDRGMSNHLFWSRDNGKTWDGPTKIDEVGGEPGYILELADGTLVYPRTEARETDQIWNPPMPWGGNYYRNVAVFSDDGGKTWTRAAVIADDPLQGDCETGLVELAPGKLMAVTRIGLSSGGFGQPSRFIFSDDNGKTWGRAQLSPIYGQRPIIRKLQSGKLLVTYRNAWGTPGTYAFTFDANEKLPYQPTSFIWDETRTQIKDGAMTINTEEGRDKGVIFALYPAQAPDSRVEIEAELRVEQTSANGVHISAGCDVKFETGRISLTDRPADGFDLDTAKWRKYRIVREAGTISVFVDGELKLKKPTMGIETRLVRFGNRQAGPWFGALEQPEGLEKIIGKRPAPKFDNASLSHWRAVSVKVENRKDHSIDWRWTARDGFPDQFRRDRIVRVDRNGSFSPGNSGYSGWTQMKDGRVVIADYTNGYPASRIPFARAYVTTEEFLTGMEK